MGPTQGIGCLGLPKAEKPAILLRSIVLAPSRLGASLRLVCASQEETRALKYVVSRRDSICVNRWCRFETAHSSALQTG
jgi:hypothetical protein